MLAVGAVFGLACGGAATPAAPATATAPTTSVSAATTTSAGTWTITNASKATVRVREQLAGVSLPSDAVLTVTGATGSFALDDEGTFSSESKISFAMTSMSSDQSQRDQFIKGNTLNTRQYPTATFVPTKVTGLTAPLPPIGAFTFTMTGKMTIHDTTKDVTFDVTAKRDGGNLTAIATANPSWKFEDFGMTTPSSPLRVLSVTDEIRVTVDLVASGPST